MALSEINYPAWAITTPRYYADEEDNTTATSLVEEIKWIPLFTEWNDKWKSHELLGSLQGLAANFAEDLLQYQIN